MKHQIFDTGLIILFLCTSWLGLAQVSLDSCQAKARRNYPLIHQYDLIQQTEEFTVSNAGKAFLPQLSFNVIGGIVDGLPSFELPGSTAKSSSDFQLISVAQVNQAIWDGGMTKANKNLAKANAAMEKSDIDISLYQIRERVDNLYFGILLMDAQIEQNRIFYRNIELNATRIKVAIENGTAYKSDLDEIRVALLNAEERIVELEYTKAAYKKVLSLMIGEPLDKNETLIRPEVEILDFQGDIKRPELMQFASQKEVLEVKAAMNRSALYPRIGVLGFGTFLNPGINFGNEEVNRILVAGLNVSWDIGGLYRNGNNKKIEALNLSRLRNREEAFRFNTQLQLGQTELELLKYQELITKNKEVLRIKERIKKAYEVKFDNGVCTMTELLDKTNEENLAGQKLILQEILYLQKVYEYKNKSGN